MKRRKSAARRTTAAKRSAPRRAKKAKARPKASKRPVRRKAAPKAAARPRAKPAGGLAQRLAAFSSRVLKEESQPVAVQSFIEAREGKRPDTFLVPKTGEVVTSGKGRAAPPVADEDEEEDDVETRPQRPRLEPLTGPAAVPRDVELEFKIEGPKPAKRGRRGEKPEKFGLVELRQATATGGRHLTRSKPENLQVGASRLQPLASSQKASKGKRAPKDRFEVAQGGAPKRGLDAFADLADPGDVEIGQQTRSGSRKVGKLRRAEDSDD